MGGERPLFPDFVQLSRPGRSLAETRREPQAHGWSLLDPVDQVVRVIDTDLAPRAGGDLGFRPFVLLGPMVQGDEDTGRGRRIERRGFDRALGVVFGDPLRHAHALSAEFPSRLALRNIVAADLRRG